MALGSKIKQIRQDRGLSQRKLAEKASLSSAYMSLIESNKKIPALKTLDDIASALGINREVLLIELGPELRQIVDKFGGIEVLREIESILSYR